MGREEYGASTTGQKKEKTDRAWFSRLVRHPARKRSGSILTTPGARTGRNNNETNIVKTRSGPIRSGRRSPVYERRPGDERQRKDVEEVGQGQRPDVAVGDRLDADAVGVSPDDDQHGHVAEHAKPTRQNRRRRRNPSRHVLHRLVAVRSRCPRRATARRRHRLVPGHRISPSFVHAVTEHGCGKASDGREPPAGISENVKKP